MLKHMHIHGLARHQIRKLFTASLPVTARSILFTQLDTCPSCAKYYMDFSRAESALCSAADGITNFAMERTEVALFENLETPKPKRTAYSRLAFAGAVGAMAVALVLFFVPLTQTSHRIHIDQHASLAPIDLIARGGGEDSANVGIRVFKVSNEGKVSDNALVSADDIITFTYTRTDPGTGFLALFGIQKDGEILWYYPDYNENASIPIDGDLVDEPLGDGIDLGVNHAAGHLQIVALFSDEPIDVKSIKEGISKLEDQTVFSTDLGPLLTKTLKVPVAQHSVMINLEQEGN